MQLFLDTADTEEIRKAHATGLISGVTTNPTLAAETGRNYHEVVREICEVLKDIKGPVSAEVTAQTAAEMVTQALRLKALHAQVVVKIPAADEWLAALIALRGKEKLKRTECKKRGWRENLHPPMRVNVTVVADPMQAFLASQFGATYVSPFLGRYADAHGGTQKARRAAERLLEECVATVRGTSTTVLAASCRDTQWVLFAQMAGAGVATMPPKVFWELLRHKNPLSQTWADKFRADFATLSEKLAAQSA